MKIKKNHPIVIFLVVAGLLIFLHFLGILRPLENILIGIAKPVSGRLYNWSSGLNSSYRERRTKEDLSAKIAFLESEAARLTVANSQCREILEENEKLRATLNFLDDNGFQAVEAAVIAKESAAADSRDLVINRGIKDGLRTGLGVINETGVIIGQVQEVKDNIASICLTINPGCRLAASIQNQSRTQGITDGDLGLTIKMEYIPQLEKIAAGDTVITSGLGGKIPRGLVIGQVAQVHNESNEVWQSATIEPIVDLDNLTVVSVIIP
ncbi:MAG: rod shape-determining protein MreC [Patescibacteria group bacterium]|jgi:rod shape-determining protein MreC